ncbi:sulfite exporter TauE/SafE family protein [Methylocystis heyeri]|nr:sulfite exporter TauE/SafE family protein [Methylocystis heyeri]
MTAVEAMVPVEAMLHVHGMHCHGCEHIIETSVGKLPGILEVKADYAGETVSVAFDPKSVDLAAIRKAIEQAGYRTFELGDPARRRGPLYRLLAAASGVAAILLIVFFDTQWIGGAVEPDVARHLSLDLIFLLGLLTGFHCVGMCGGFVLSYTADDAAEGRHSYLSHILYGAGKTLSYVAIGAAFGFLGAFVAFTPLLRGMAGLFAGLFLIVFGLNMLGLFAPLRRFRLGLPAPLQRFVFSEQKRSRHRPFVIGLLNGLMIACGPLQAMYVMAAGTGSAFEGAKMLLAFALGTLPVLLGFGFAATLISSAVTHRLLRTSGIIVVVLGAVMINRGLILTASGYDLSSAIERLGGTSGSGRQSEPLAENETAHGSGAAEPLPAFQTIRMQADEFGYAPNRFVLIRGVPVKWVIDGKRITTCNRRIIAPGLGLEFDVRQGAQTIEFTPKTVGVVPWSCWMGMLRGEFDVVERPGALAAGRSASAASAQVAASRQAPSPCASVGELVVAAGDSLRGLAKRYYGKAKFWNEIAAANPGLDPLRLRPGMKIKLPRPLCEPRKIP